MRLFTMETRCHGEDPPSKAFIRCEVDNMAAKDGDFRSILYFDLDNQGPCATASTQKRSDVNGIGERLWDSDAEDGAPGKSAFHGRHTPLHAQLLTKTLALQPVRYSETMTVSAIPNYEERYVTTWVDVNNKKRYNEQVNFEPKLTPVNYSSSIICYRNSTRRKFLSHVDYEPRVRPHSFSECTFVYPKSAETTFVSVLDYHIDECRRWFKSSVELKAKTYTTSRIQHEKPAVPRYSVTKTVTKQPKDADIQHNDAYTNGYLPQKLLNGTMNGLENATYGSLKDANDNYYDDSEC